MELSQVPAYLHKTPTATRFQGWISEKLGVSQAVAFALSAKSWAVLSGAVMIWLIFTYFSAETQGYYYTFASLILLQNLLELGFGVVLIQFISHEWGFLKISEGKVEGDADATARLASLVKLGALWYLVLSFGFFVIVGSGGYLFLLRHRPIDIAWQQPWWLLCAAVSLSILLVPLRCFVEGSNQVATSQRIGLLTVICSGMAGWIAIVSGANLYTLVAIAGTTALVGHSLFWRPCLPFFRLLTLSNSRSVSRIRWGTQFWPQQWRIGVSWLSGLLMFQAFVPILFYLHGPVPAGRLGVTMQIYHAINSVASAWLVSAGPTMGILASRRQFSTLRQLVGQTTRRSVVACSLLSSAVFLLVAFLHHWMPEYGKRFGDVLSVGVFLAVVVVMQVTNVETTAVRFQKKEPFVVASVVCAALVTLSNALLGRFFAVRGVAIGFAMVTLLILLPWVHGLYRREMPQSTVVSSV